MIKFIENIKLALRAILSNKVRSFLTMLGIIIGVFAIVLLIGLGQGVKKDVTGEITELGANVIAVIPGNLEDEEGNIDPSAGFSGIGASTLTESDLAALGNLEYVENYTPLSLLAGLPSAGDNTVRAAMTLAVTAGFFDFFNSAEIVAGRTLSDNDVDNKKRVIVLDEGPKNQLFPGLENDEVIGKTMKFGAEEFEVIGILKSPEVSALTGGGMSNVIIMPFTTAKELFENTQMIRIILVVNEELDVDETAEKIKAVMLEQHEGINDFSVFTQEDLLGVINSVLNLITSAVVAIGSISLLVGGIGIMNIMLVSVTERTKEIGIRKAIGAASSDILTQFLIEAIVLSITGAIIALLAAWGVGILVTAQTGVTVDISISTISLAIGFSLAIGVIFGVAPASRAARLNPIDALRYE
ncbi:ABC transporter permease [Patescibacteria group bacterium]